MTTEAQKILFTDIEMIETFGGWMPKVADDYDKLLEMLNNDSVSQEDVCDNTHYTFSDGSVIIETMNKEQEKVFNHYL